MMELYPKSEVVVCIQVLQSDGGNTMAAINAGTLASIHTRARFPHAALLRACHP